MYEIVDPIGAGGMGNVYRARDSRLGRDVAIKALPDEVARDSAALARFEREARFLASLNHPNIASIYGIEEHGGERFLILELVPGDTLATVLERGPLSLDQTIQVATEVASALEAAHEAGIIHRDLKPSNVKLTHDGRVKLLDFGIAKHLPSREVSQTAAGTDLTRAGSVLGTPTYMSPEQILGGEVDRRSDIWAFGCLVYEMATGKRAFEGDTYIALADSIRNTEPDWNALPRAMPDGMRRLLMRCLRKDPHERLHDIGDARVELREIQQDRSGARRGARMSRGWLAATLAVAAALLVVGALVWRRSPPVRESSRATLRFTPLTSAEGVEEFPAWSPDGATIAFARDVGGVRKLFIKRLDSGEEEQLTKGDFDDLQPAWAADGRRVLFVRAREAKRRVEPSDVFAAYMANMADVWVIDLTTRRETRFVENAYYPSASPDGKSVAVDAAWAGPRRIWLVDSHGYNPQQLTSEESEAVAHLLPRWSPDGARIVYQRIEGTRFDIATVDVGTRRSTRVTSDNYREVNPAWARDGKSIYFSSDRGGGMNLWRVAVAADGTPRAPFQQLTSGAGQDIHLALSPDGKRLAYATLRQNADLWRLPLTAAGTVAGPAAPLVATTREDSRGAWSPDGRTVAFNSDRAGDMNVWLHSLADGTTRQLTRGPGGDFQPTWSPDSRQIVFFSSRAGNADIWKVDVASGALTQLTHDRTLEINPFFSPDGNEIMYQSDASGRLELWIMGADGSRARKHTDGGVWGHFTRWLPDGFIYFRASAQSGIVRVPAAGGDVERVSQYGGGHISFSPDGKRFIDVVGHKVVWLYFVDGRSERLFEFDNPDVRIDYPMWSPDGRWLLFDRFRPEGGDIWLADGID